MTTTTRVYRFSSSHRLHCGSLSAEENNRIYGKCNNPFGHGHNYTLHVGVAGETDVISGRVISPGALDRFVEERILRVFEHKDMNSDVPDFSGVPTTENLAADVKRRLDEGWKERFGNAELVRISIQETPRNRFELKIR